MSELCSEELGQTVLLYIVSDVRFTLVNSIGQDDGECIKPIVA